MKFRQHAVQDRRGPVGNGCESNLRGAKYAASRVTLTEHLLASWDQGFDETGKQVWGAEKGGYRFVKEEGGSESRR